MVRSHLFTCLPNPGPSPQLVRVKDKTEKCATVCHIHFEQSTKQYFGETSRLLETFFS